MNKLIIAAVSAGALAVSGPLFASEVHLAGAITEVCEVTDFAITSSFVTMEAGKTLSAAPTIKCNGGNGATLKLETAEGGMESDTVEDLVLDYTASLSGLPSEDAIAPFSLATDGTNDKISTINLGHSPELAAGINTVLTVTLDEDGIYSGGYSDTLSLEIVAR